METIGNRLKRLRVQAKIPVAVLAMCVGTDPFNIKGIEADRREISQGLLERIAVFLDVSKDYLLGRVADRNMKIVEGKQLPTIILEIGINSLIVDKDIDIMDLPRKYLEELRDKLQQEFK